jgi:hypothetical protein
MHGAQGLRMRRQAESVAEPFRQEIPGALDQLVEVPNLTVRARAGYVAGPDPAVGKP